MADGPTDIPVGDNPYAPQEPPELISLEKADFIGLNLSDMLYGVAALLFFRCISALLLPRRGHQRKPLLALYTFVLFALGTIFTGMSINTSVLAFIENRNFPGGPEAYALFRYSSVLWVTPNTVFILANWLADGLLLYRCRIIWIPHTWILIFPGIMYLGSISMGIMTIFQASQPDSSLWATVTVSFALPYFSLSAALNTILTLLICGRLIVHQRRLNQNMGSKASSLPYSNIVMMLIESCAIYAVSSLIFIGTYASNNVASATFLPILSQTQIIAPLLIISRVARQRDWIANSEAARTPSSAVFRSTTTHVDSIPLELSPRSGTFKKEDAV